MVIWPGILISSRLKRTTNKQNAENDGFDYTFPITSTPSSHFLTPVPKADSRLGVPSLNAADSQPPVKKWTRPAPSLSPPTCARMPSGPSGHEKKRIGILFWWSLKEPEPFQQKSQQKNWLQLGVEEAVGPNQKKLELLQTNLVTGVMKIWTDEVHSAPRNSVFPDSNKQNYRENKAVLATNNGFNHSIWRRTSSIRAPTLPTGRLGEALQDRGLLEGLPALGAVLHRGAQVPAVREVHDLPPRGEGRTRGADGSSRKRKT